jgi:hypothetical protein
MMVLADRPRPGRYVLAQAAVLLAVFVVLAVTPAPVTFPSGPWEVVLLLKGAAAVLLTDILLSGLAGVRARRPRSTAAAGARPVRSGDMAGLGHYHVQDSTGVVGIIDEVIGDRIGSPRALVVTDGWFGRRRFLVRVDELRAVDHEARTITIEDVQTNSLP